MPWVFTAPDKMCHIQKEIETQDCNEQVNTVKNTGVVRNNLTTKIFHSDGNYA